MLGLVSGGACAAGQWAWKNLAEEKATELSNKVKDQNQEPKEKED